MAVRGTWQGMVASGFPADRRCWRGGKKLGKSRMTPWKTFWMVVLRVESQEKGNVKDVKCEGIGMLRKYKRFRILA